MTSQQWTRFWNKLNITTEKRSLAVKGYKSGPDKSALKHLRISKDAIEHVYALTQKYPDSLLFNKFSKFVRKDIDAVKQWTKSKNRSIGFRRLFDIIEKNSMETALSKFLEIQRYFLYTEKGEGRSFVAKNTSGNINSYTPNDLVRRLNIKSTSRYLYKGKTTIGKDIIFCIAKSPKGKVVLKFIKLSSGKNRISISIAMDSKKEFSKTKDSLQKHFKTFLDVPESTHNLSKLKNFIKTGISKSFIATGVSYFDGPYKHSIFPGNNRILNVLESIAYKVKMRHVPKKELQLSDFRIYYRDKSIQRPIKISFLTSATSRILGAILLISDDRKLTKIKKAKLKSDFRKDLGVPLNEYIKYDDLSDSDVYRYFLQTVPKKNIQLELRSPKSLKVYQSLLKNNILEVDNRTEEQARFCINNNCINKYRVEWNRKTCFSCGDILVLGKKVITMKISESNITTYIKNKFTVGAIKKFNNTLLSRKLSVASVAIDDSEVELIPLTSEIKENQLEVLSHRFPNTILVSSLDNIQSLADSGFTAVSLHELIYNMEEANGKLLHTKLREARRKYNANLHRLSGIASERISSDDHYLERNKEIKNLGAELFEADCSVMLDDIFGNSLWLGARHRGRSVPDGFTAFPLIKKNEGCFIWDAKFSQNKQIVMGKFAKNKAYIKAAKNNPSIKTNGGLKAFIFISNKTFPKSFQKKYEPLSVGYRIKVNFLTSSQLKLIWDHYKTFEKIIQSNSIAKKTFIDSMKGLLFSTEHGIKCQVIDDNIVQTALMVNKSLLNPILKKRNLQLK